MKKWILWALSAVMVLSLAACSGGSSKVVINSVDDLDGKTIGVQLGTTGDIFAEDIPDATIERYAKGDEAVLALRQGKVDAVIIDDQPAKVYASKNNDIKVLEEPFAVEDYAICIAKENRELTAEFNGAIAALKADGTLQSILDHYIGQVEGSSPYQSPEGLTYTRTLTMATNAHFPPYEYWENDKVCGLDADFAKAICDNLGYDLVIEDMNFDAIITAVATGKADFGAAGMTVTEERLKNIDFTDSYCTGIQAIIVKK